MEILVHMVIEAGGLRCGDCGALFQLGSTFRVISGEDARLRSGTPPPLHSGVEP